LIMLLTSGLHSVRRFYAELDYARHFPKAYVERMKRTIPRKVYDNRIGAPPVTRWVLPPDDHIPMVKRPWENDALGVALNRANEYHSKQIATKFFRKRINKVKRIPDEEWTFFPGDLVRVLVGPDKGKEGTISHVIRDMNAVFVNRYHRKFKTEVDEAVAARHGMDEMHKWEEQPLFIDKMEVQLLDLNDREPCDAKWVLNDTGNGYDRISTRTGYKIPLPSMAFYTYEYVSPKDYIEVVGKDTPAKDVLKMTFSHKLCTFEQEIEQSLGLKPRIEQKQTYWY